MFNNYLSIANNDYEFVRRHTDYSYTNCCAIWLEQCTEKYLKHLIKTYCKAGEHNLDEILKSYNLVMLNRVLLRHNIDLDLDEKELLILTSYYYDANEPCDRYYVISKKMFSSSLCFVDYCREKVFDYLRSRNTCVNCGSL